MNETQEEKMKQLAKELAKDIKTPEDLSALSSQLMKLTVEAALGAEMEHHLGGKFRGVSEQPSRERQGSLVPPVNPCVINPNGSVNLYGEFKTYEYLLNVCGSFTFALAVSGSTDVNLPCLEL